MIKISPSILGADVMHIGRDVQKMENAGCDWLHVDVMDGVFVPNISFGPNIVAGLRKQTKLFLDVHLMITSPEKYIDVFAKAGANLITVHQEAAQLPACLDLIHKAGCKAGVSIKPGTKPDVLFPSLSQIDLVLIMTVEPGFGGQKFMADMIEKVSALRKAGYTGEIEADGGINAENAKLLADAGCSVMVMGTALFTAENPKAVIDAVKAYA